MLNWGPFLPFRITIVGCKYWGGFGDQRCVWGCLEEDELGAGEENEGGEFEEGQKTKKSFVRSFSPGGNSCSAVAPPGPARCAL